MEQKRRIVPPVYLLVALLAMTALHYWLPIAPLLRAPFTWLGALVIIAGIAVAVSAVRLFDRAGTPVLPFEPSTALVTDGLYRYTRNPMYLGLALVLLGAWMLFGTLGPGLAFVAFVWVIQSNFIRGEERFLESIFGEQYVSYRARVRRWI
jgi:protein-S-isoprenylcysteine O-methyltransferase Ste14